MEKIKISLNRKIEKELEKEYNQAIKNTEFNALIKKIGVKEDVILKNVTKIKDSICELNNCKKCEGLFQCKNKVEGHVYFPEKYEEKIKFNYVPCKFQKQQLTDLANKSSNKKEILNARMKNIDISDKNRIDLIKKIKKFYDDYDPSKTMKGLYLHGSFGSGKTFLISCLFNELKEKKNINAEIVYFPDLLRNLRDNFDALESKVAYLQRVPLLLLDDMGAENVTSWGRDEILGSILQYRMNEGLSTFFTSNLNIKELERHLSLTKNSEDHVKARRIIERIKQLTEDIELVSINRR